MIRSNNTCVGNKKERRKIHKEGRGKKNKE